MDSAFDDFWQASELNERTLVEFAQRLNSYDGKDNVLRLEYPEEATKLPRIKTKLSKIARQRKTERTFSDSPITVDQIATILSSFSAQGGLEHRNYPAAGALYTVEIFHVLFNAGGLSEKILYYNPEQHGYVTLPNKAPHWNDTTRSKVNIEVEGTPQSLVLFVCFPERIAAKYGERGGRFALYEVGAAVQQLSLTIAESKKLKGVAVGGVVDSYWKSVLGLNTTDARIALGYLVGV